MAFDYFTYYSIGLFWGLYLRRIWSPLALLAWVFHDMFYLLVFGRGSLSQPEYFVAMPFTIYFGVQVGYLLKMRCKSPPLIFVKHIRRHHWWLSFAVVQFVILHLMLLAWEKLDRPWNFIVTLVIYLIAILLLYFTNRSADIWSYTDRDGKVKRDHYGAEVFHSNWFVLYVFFTVPIFGIVDWAWPDFWQFWVGLAVFGLHLLLIFLFWAGARAANWKANKFTRCNDTGVMFVGSVKVSASDVQPGATDAYSGIYDPLDKEK